MLFFVGGLCERFEALGEEGRGMAEKAGTEGGGVEEEVGEEGRGVEEEVRIQRGRMGYDD